MTSYIRDTHLSRKEKEVENGKGLDSFCEECKEVTRWDKVRGVLILERKYTMYHCNGCQSYSTFKYLKQMERERGDGQQSTD